MAGILDTFTYVFKAKDEGVDKKLSDIDKKSKDTSKSVEGVTKSFSEFGEEARKSVESIVPGANKVIDSLKKIGEHMRRARGGASASGNGGGGLPKPPAAGGGGSASGAGGVAAEAEGASAALGAMTIAAGFAAVAVGILTKAFIEGAEDLSKSRRAAQDAGVNSTQMAAAEQYAKSLKLDKSEIQTVLKTIGDKTREGYVTAHTFGNIFGLGNETTQLLKRHGIRTETGGKLRNSYVILDDISKKMQGMTRDAAIGFGQFFGMTKDVATALRDGTMSMDEFARANQTAIQQQAKAIDGARAYEKAQQQLSNAWDDFKVRVGGQLLPIVTELVQDVANATDGIADLGSAISAFWRDVKDIAEQITGWVSDHTPDFLKGNMPSIGSLATGGAFGQGGALSTVWQDIKGTVKDTFSFYKDEQKGFDHSKAVDAVAADLKASTGKDVDRATAEAELAKREAAGREEYLKKVNQGVSDNNSAAQTQLEAANAMKVATNRFGLSTEQYMAMWGAKAGREGGLASSGGVGPEQFQAAYKDARSKFATDSTYAAALYGRGAPMMAQLPGQYVQGMGINPFGGPAHPIGLQQAKSAVSGSGMNISGGAAGAAPAQVKQNDITVNMGGVTINTQSDNPQAVNDAITNHAQGALKYTLSKLDDGQKA